MLIQGNSKSGETEPPPKPPENTKVEIPDKNVESLPASSFLPPNQKKLWNPLNTSLVVGGSMAVLIFLLTAIVRGYALWQDFISNFFVFGLISSLVILVRRRFVKKQVKSFKDPNSGGIAVLVFSIGFLVYLCIFVFLLISPAFRHFGQSPQSNISSKIVVPSNTPLISKTSKPLATKTPILVSPSLTPILKPTLAIDPNSLVTTPMGREDWRFPLAIGVKHLGDINTKSEQYSTFIEDFISYYQIPRTGYWDIFYVSDGSNVDEIKEKYLNTLKSRDFLFGSGYDLHSDSIIKSFSFIKKYNTNGNQYDVYYFTDSGIMVVLYYGIKPKR